MSEPFAVTDRLILRDFREEDVAKYAALGADPEVMRYVGGVQGAADAASEARAISENFARTGYGMLVVERRSDAAFLGICGLSVERWYPDDLQIGWRLLREHWGQGYATEAALIWRDAAFAMAIERLISISDTPNRRSHRVMQKLGMRYDHTAMLADDHETFEAHVYLLSRAEWAALKD